MDPMTERLITGTVRARKGNRFVVIRPDGEQLLVALEGIDEPRLGVDIIGVLDGVEGDLRMRLVPDVTRMLLEGKSRIISGGRPDLTARMLARLLKGTSPSSIRPGIGGMIERTPTFHDHDIAWALDILEPEARKAGIALNVIDPMALADSAWENASLRETVLPADTSGEDRALKDLHRLLNAGMAPSCCRTIMRIGRGVEVPSVDFVMPYSPFATGMSWSAGIAKAWNDEIVTMSISGSDARRLSTFRELALAFAPRYLGRNKGEGSSHIEQSFADAAAAIAFMNFGGSPQTVLRFQRLREAALARWSPPEDIPPATSEALAATMSLAAQAQPDSADDILQLAASMAKAHTPTTEEGLVALCSRATANDVFVRLDRVSRPQRTAILESYSRDLKETVDRLRGSDRAMARMAMFGIYTIPSGCEDDFDVVLGDVPPSDVDGFEFDNDFVPSATPAL